MVLHAKAVLTVGASSHMNIILIHASGKVMRLHLIVLLVVGIVHLLILKRESLYFLLKQRLPLHLRRVHDQLGPVLVLVSGD